MNKQLALAAFTVFTATAFVWACSDDAKAPQATSSSGTAATSGGTSGDGTSGTTSGTSGTDPTPADAKKAKATLSATTDGGTVKGTIDFEEKGSVVVVNVSVTGATPPGEHGLHIHDKGSCDPVDGGAGLGAGGHWNPAGDGGKHGYPSGDLHHAGDLGNLLIDDAGAGSTKLTFPSTAFYVHEGPLSVVGHAVVFHAFRDDGVSQPVGDAGARPGCGIIAKE